MEPLLLLISTPFLSLFAAGIGKLLRYFLNNYYKRSTSTIRIKFPNGKVVELEIPAGTSELQARQMIDEMLERFRPAAPRQSPTESPSA